MYSAGLFSNPARESKWKTSSVKILRGVRGELGRSSQKLQSEMLPRTQFRNLHFPYELLSRRCAPQVNNPDPKANSSLTSSTDDHILDIKSIPCTEECITQLRINDTSALLHLSLTETIPTHAQGFELKACMQLPIKLEPKVRWCASICNVA